MSNNLAQIPIIKFHKDHLQNNLSPLIQKQHFWLQDELVVSFSQFSNIIMLTKDQGMFFRLYFIETLFNFVDTTIQNRKY